MLFTAPAGILGFREKIPLIFGKTEDKQMKLKVAAALFCAGLLAAAPVSGVPATLPGGYYPRRKCGGLCCSQ